MARLGLPDLARLGCSTSSGLPALLVHLLAIRNLAYREAGRTERPSMPKRVVTGGRVLDPALCESTRSMRAGNVRNNCVGLHGWASSVRALTATRGSSPNGPSCDARCLELCCGTIRPIQELTAAAVGRNKWQKRHPFFGSSDSCAVVKYGFFEASPGQPVVSL